jgi:hypothetical protein
LLRFTGNNRRNVGGVTGFFAREPQQDTRQSGKDACEGFWTSSNMNLLTD